MVPSILLLLGSISVFTNSARMTRKPEVMPGPKSRCGNHTGVDEPVLLQKLVTGREKSLCFGRRECLIVRGGFIDLLVPIKREERNLEKRFSKIQHELKE